MIVGGSFNHKKTTKSKPPAVIAGGEGWRGASGVMPNCRFAA